MASFRLTLTINRLCMSPLTPLDGSISGMIAEDTLPDLSRMFDHQSGVPMASYPIFESVYTTDHSVLRSLKQSWIMNGVPEQIAYSSSSMTSVTDNKSVSYHRGNTQRVYHPKNSTVAYYFSGDGDAVKEVLERHRAIGAWTGRGYGNMVEDHASEVLYLHEFPNTPLCGITDEENKLIRPVPISMARSLKIDPDSYYEQFGRASIPYGPNACRIHGYSGEPLAMPIFAYDPPMVPNDE